MDKYILTRQVSSPGPHDTDWILSGLPHPGPVHLKHFKASPGWRPLIANMQMTSNNRPRDIVASGLTCIAMFQYYADSTLLIIIPPPTFLFLFLSLSLSLSLSATY